MVHLIIIIMQLHASSTCRCNGSDAFSLQNVSPLHVWDITENLVSKMKRHLDKHLMTSVVRRRVSCKNRMSEIKKICKQWLNQTMWKLEHRVNGNSDPNQKWCQHSNRDTWGEKTKRWAEVMNIVWSLVLNWISRIWNWKLLHVTRIHRLYSHQERYMSTIVFMYSICSIYNMIALLYRPYVWVCACERVPARVCVCVCMCTLSLPLLSASTLNESELQYSVGGAGIEYPAGGSSTHAKRFMRAHISITLEWWNTFSQTLRSDDDLKWPVWGSRTGCKSVTRTVACSRAAAASALYTQLHACTHANTACCHIRPGAPQRGL